MSTREKIRLIARAPSKFSGIEVSIRIISSSNYRKVDMIHYPLKCLMSGFSYQRNVWVR